MPDKEERHHNCRGCFDFHDCEIASNPDQLKRIPVKRAASNEKFFSCHSLHAVARPPDPKDARRTYGEAAVQH
jgi:hypothetical protein